MIRIEESLTEEELSILRACREGKLNGLLKEHPILISALKKLQQRFHKCANVDCIRNLLQAGES